MLTNQDIKRYSRQLLVSGIEESGQHNIASAHVVVIGLGGLGSLAARYLAGAGVGRITLVDGDIVDISNLQRQVSYNEMHLGDLKAKALSNELYKVNPNIDIHAKCLYADSKNLPSLMNTANCVLDCTDNVAIRQQINQACVDAQIPLFIAAASGNTWQAINVATNKEGGCYNCLVNSIQVQENCITQGVLGPVVGMAACHQTTQALLYLARKDNANLKWGHYLTANAATGEMHTFSLPRSTYCKVCYDNH